MKIFLMVSINFFIGLFDYGRLATGSLDFRDCRLGESVRSHVDRSLDLSVTEHLHEVVLAGEAGGHDLGDAELIQEDPAGFSRIRINGREGWVDSKAVKKALPGGLF